MKGSLKGSGRAEELEIVGTSNAVAQRRAAWSVNRWRRGMIRGVAAGVETPVREHSLRSSSSLLACVLCSTEECEVRAEVVHSGVHCLRCV